MKHLEDIKNVKKILCKIMIFSEMQFDFMPEKVAIDAVLILRRQQEEYDAARRV